jgi:hypothetical protein
MQRRVNERAELHPGGTAGVQPPHRGDAGLLDDVLALGEDGDGEAAHFLHGHAGRFGYLLGTLAPPNALLDLAWVEGCFHRGLPGSGLEVGLRGRAG